MKVLPALLIEKALDFFLRQFSEAARVIVLKENRRNKSKSIKEL